jgi:putative transposase
MNPILHPIFALLASVTRQELARQVAYLKEENKILRARLPERLVATPQEKRRLLKFGRKLGVKLRDLISIVSYQTFVRWIREKEASHAEKKATSTRKPGRPRTPDDIRDLVLKLARENSWGYTRILGELRKLGIKSVSRQTVKMILKEHGIDPGPKRGKGSWDEFLKIHADTLWQCDFLSKPMWTARGLVDVYLLVFLHLGSRRVWISPSTVQPDSAWVSLQARNFLIIAEDMGLSPEYLMRDNDAKFSGQFDEVFKTSGVQIKRTVPMSPNLRAHVERFIQTLKFECLSKFIIVAEKHLGHICRIWSRHYNEERPHSSRDHLPPDFTAPPEEATTVRVSDIVCTSKLGGVIHSYSRRAA